MHDLPRPDPALGVFETMLARDGGIQALPRHLDRLATATAALYAARLPSDLGHRIRTTAAAFTTAHRLRVDAIPQPSRLITEIAATEIEPGRRHEPPIKLQPVVIAGGIGPYKWRDRRLLDALHDEHTVPLILDEHDELLEAGSMNVWILEGATIVTPPADGRLLPGVTRALLLELARTLDLEARTERITLERARAADTIFVTSSIRRISAAALADDTGPAPQTALIQTAKQALDTVEWS